MKRTIVKPILLLVAVFILFGVHAQTVSFEQDCNKQFALLCGEIKKSNYAVSNSKQNSVDGKENNNYSRLFEKYFVAIDLSNGRESKETVKTQIDSELKDFAGYILGNTRDTLHDYSIKPVRLSRNTSMVTGIDSFQLSHTFVLFDKVNPDRELMYILFLPALPGITGNVPKILAWKLAYSYNKYFFVDLLGQQGIELFFEGVQKPVHPVNIGNN